MRKSYRPCRPLRHSRPQAPVYGLRATSYKLQASDLMRFQCPHSPCHPHPANSPVPVSMSTSTSKIQKPTSRRSKQKEEKVPIPQSASANDHVAFRLDALARLPITTLTGHYPGCHLAEHIVHLFFHRRYLLTLMFGHLGLPVRLH